MIIVHFFGILTDLRFSKNLNSEGLQYVDSLCRGRLYSINQIACNLDFVTIFTLSKFISNSRIDCTGLCTGLH